MAQSLNTLTRLGVAIALVGGAANSMLYNGKRILRVNNWSLLFISYHITYLS